MPQSNPTFEKALRIATILYAIFAGALLVCAVLVEEFSRASSARKIFGVFLAPALFAMVAVAIGVGEGRRLRLAVGLLSGWTLAVSAILSLGLWDILPARMFLWILSRLDVVLWILAALGAWLFVESVLVWRRLYLERGKGP